MDIRTSGPGQQGRHVLLTGATGFIGLPLTRSLLDSGWQVSAWVRDYAKARHLLGSEVRLLKSLDEISSEDRIDVMINLAGAGIAEQPWSRARKKLLLDSRLQTTRALVQLAQRLDKTPDQLLSASAIGFYGPSSDIPLTETSPGGDGFSHELCKRWEEEASKADALGIKVCLMRLGVVLAAGGGMLARMLPLFRAGLGGRTGSGTQYLSWIHRDDVLAAIHFLISGRGSGIYNLTAPGAVTNAEFSRQLAAALHRPAWLHQPQVVISLLFGEMGEQLLLRGQNVAPARLQEEGFGFLCPVLSDALSRSLR